MSLNLKENLWHLHKEIVRVQKTKVEHKKLFKAKVI